MEGELSYERLYRHCLCVCVCVHPCCPVHSVIFPSVQDQSLNPSAKENAGTGDTDEIKSSSLSVRRDTLVVRAFSA